MSTEELMKLIDQFDDAKWVRDYGGSLKAQSEQLEYMEEQEMKDLIRGYWSILSKMLCN